MRVRVSVVRCVCDGLCVWTMMWLGGLCLADGEWERVSELWW